MKNLITKSFILSIHIIALAGVLYAPFYYSNIAMTVLSFAFMGFGVTVGYHRYFSHRSFKTSRLFQFILGIWGSLSLQGGVLFWSLSHRHHHRHSDQEEDLHSPKHGFWHSHVGWLGDAETFSALQDEAAMKWADYPELSWLERYFLLPPLAMFAACALIGYLMNGSAGALRIATWGYFLPVVVSWHITWCINSVTHVVGKRRFETKDDSRNFWLLGLFGLGEGWHNNHHRFPTSIRHGMYWYEIDLSYYVILLFKWLGLVWDTREYPEKLKQEGKKKKTTETKKEATHP